MSHGHHRHKARPGAGKNARRCERSVRSRRRRAIKASRDRDAKVTAEHGERGHGSCGRKRRYPTLQIAMHVASFMHVGHGAPELRAYRCCYCGGWHLTSMPLDRWPDAETDGDE